MNKQEVNNDTQRQVSQRLLSEINLIHVLGAQEGSTISYTIFYFYIARTHGHTVLLPGTLYIAAGISSVCRCRCHCCCCWRCRYSPERDLTAAAVAPATQTLLPGSIESKRRHHPLVHWQQRTNDSQSGGSTIAATHTLLCCCVM